jgi:RNAse (barnase) inhibitor barstar
LSHLDDLQSGQGLPQLYRWSESLDWEFLAAAVHNGGGRAFYLDGQRMATPEMLMQEFAQVLEFPDYFGQNWDALEDCLTDLSWLEGKISHVVLAIDHWHHCASPILKDVLAQAITLWADSPTPMYVLLRGDGLELQKLPLVDY